jgi:endonuclease/exonuclease/phosphatase family metal-dependent hydrolase
VLAEERTRQSLLSVLENSIDSLYEQSEGGMKIIIAGDFNCTPDDLDLNKISDKGGNYSLTDLSAAAAARGEGTYRYRGKWEMIDQVIVSDGILDAASGVYTNADLIKIFKPDFLLQKDPGYPGMVPFPTYRGFSYLGGFSDHLPVIVDLRIR